VVCSIDKQDHIRGGSIWFYAVGIGKENARDPQYGWPLKKFSTLVSECHDENVSSTISHAFLKHMHNRQGLVDRTGGPTQNVSTIGGFDLGIVP